MNVGPFIVEPDTLCWVVKEPKVVKKKGGKMAGEEYFKVIGYPGRLDQALRYCLELMVRRKITPESSLAEAIATVAHMYRTVGEVVRDEVEMRRIFEMEKPDEE